MDVGNMFRADCDLWDGWGVAPEVCLVGVSDRKRERKRRGTNRESDSTPHLQPAARGCHQLLGILEGSCPPTQEEVVRMREAEIGRRSKATILELTL